MLNVALVSRLGEYFFRPSLAGDEIEGEEAQNERGQQGKETLASQLDPNGNLLRY